MNTSLTAVKDLTSSVANRPGSIGTCRTTPTFWSVARTAAPERKVWYVGFGSNLCEQRLRAYLGDAETGLPYTGKIVSGPAMRLPYQLHFAARSAKWGGAVAFIRPLTTKEAKAGRYTIGRPYLLTESQVLSIIAQENGAKRLKARVDLYELEHHHQNPTDFRKTWYGRIARFGDLGGIPAVAVTTGLNTLAPGMPSDKYLDVIRRGLVECGLSNVEIADYLAPTITRKATTSTIIGRLVRMVRLLRQSR